LICVEVLLCYISVVFETQYFATRCGEARKNSKN